MKDKLIAADLYSAKKDSQISLYKDLWIERTTALLHAPREVDKTAFAFDIIADLNYLGHKVIYVNCETRLDRNLSILEKCSSTFIFTPEFESVDDTSDYSDLVIKGIEEAVSTTDVRCFVVDSVSRIAALSFGKNSSPAYVLKRLVSLQKRLGISLLVIAHDHTKAVDRALLMLADSEITVDSDVEQDTSFKPQPSAMRSSEFKSAKNFFAPKSDTYDIPKSSYTTPYPDYNTIEKTSLEHIL